jgi:hypothetical protein
VLVQLSSVARPRPHSSPWIAADPVVLAMLVSVLVMPHCLIGNVATAGKMVLRLQAD